MLARAKRNSEITTAYQQSSCVVSYPYKNGDKHLKNNYRPIIFITFILQNLHKIWYW